MLELPHRVSFAFTCCGRSSDEWLESTWLENGWSPVTEEPWV